ncbi:MAG: Killer protein [Granulosicoccus sp.]|nr:Killer protein [Granulosicoccus sp.]
MITSIRHKGLKQFFESGSKKGIQAAHENSLRLMLAALDTSTTIDDMDVPGYRLHPLKGERKGRWSVSVSGNWRLTFTFVDGNGQLLDYEGYH